MSDGFEFRKENYYRHLKKVLSSDEILTAPLKKFYQTIVDLPFYDLLTSTYLELGIVVLLMVDDEGKEVHRVALSNTVHAAGATKTSEKNFSDIKIPFNYAKNIITTAIKTGKTIRTIDWKDLFAPALTAASARFNQAGAGIACSYVTPFAYKTNGAALIFSFFNLPTDFERIHCFTSDYAKLVSRAFEKRSLTHAQ